MKFVNTVLALSAVASVAASPARDRDTVMTPEEARRLQRLKAIAHGHIGAALQDRGILDGIFGNDDDDAHGYAPYNVTCPSDVTWVRKADAIGKVESDYLQEREQQLQDAWKKQTSDLGMDMPKRTPKVAMALSGGGYRAMIHGAGQAFLPNNTKGSVGDILGMSSYVGGLSGGSWAVSTFLANNAASPDFLARNIWNISDNLVVPDDGKVSFYTNLVDQVTDKASKGYRTQITDYWGLALGNHLFPGQYHVENKTPNLTITDIRSVPSVANASVPFPVIIAVEREPDEYLITVNSTIWEFTLGEWGSWYWGAEEKTQGGFTDVQYLGTRMENGKPTGNDDCILGYSNLGFIAGTSATLFNQGLVRVVQADGDSILKTAIEGILSSISDAYNDVAVYPNAFRQWNPEGGNNPVANFDNITLVDGGEANENVPLEPFLVPQRKVDAILAMDNSADTDYSWANGSSLWTSYQKSLAQREKYNISTPMPIVPSTNGFVNGGLNTRVTFFGCNETDKPLIIYVPNYPWNTYSNTSTLQLEYEIEQAAAMVENGRRSLEMNGTVDNWPTCLTCALMDRAVIEDGGQRSEDCQKCFDTWCWNGEDDNKEPEQPFNPVLGVLPQFIQDLTNKSAGTGVPFKNTTESGEAQGDNGALGGAFYSLPLALTAFAAVTVSSIFA